MLRDAKDLLQVVIGEGLTEDSGTFQVRWVAGQLWIIRTEGHNSNTVYAIQRDGSWKKCQIEISLPGHRDSDLEEFFMGLVSKWQELFPPSEFDVETSDPCLMRFTGSTGLPVEGMSGP